MRKIIILLVFFAVMLSVIAEGTEEKIINDALDDVELSEIENYIKNNNEYLKNNNFNLGNVIMDIISGNNPISFADYFKYLMEEEINYFKDNIKKIINILVVSIVLTIISYFAQEKSNTSEIVFLISILIIFSLVIKDLIGTKEMIKGISTNIENVNTKLNAFFLTTMLTVGKLSILQFFQNYSNYTITLTTKVVFWLMDLSILILVPIIIINNMSNLFNLKLLYKFLKKAVFIIICIYIFIVVINFSVQGYILYRVDNVFINSIKALSPASIPVIGNAVNNFFGVFFKSLLLIKDIIGLIFIVFILFTFGSTAVKIVFLFIIYKLAATLIEPFNTKISIFINEIADIFNVYLLCYLTPIIIITAYYSIVLNYITNVFN